MKIYHYLKPQQAPGRRVVERFPGYRFPMIIETATATGAIIASRGTVGTKQDLRIPATTTVIMLVMNKIDGRVTFIAITTHRTLPPLLCKSNYLSHRGTGSSSSPGLFPGNSFTCPLRASISPVVGLSSQSSSEALLRPDSPQNSVMSKRSECSEPSASSMSMTSIHPLGSKRIRR